MRGLPEPDHVSVDVHYSVFFLQTTARRAKTIIDVSIWGANSEREFFLGKGQPTSEFVRNPLCVTFVIRVVAIFYVMTRALKFLLFLKHS